MSISRIQRERILEEVTRTLYASGEKPTLSEILNRVSRYVSDNPLGAPLDVTGIAYAEPDMRSKTDLINEALLNTILNIDVAYEATDESVENLMFLTSILKGNLEKLAARRKKIVSKIDDYLFSTYNADGYYYSLSDDFSTLDKTDLPLTSAFVDQAAGVVAIPTNSDLTKKVTIDKITSVEFTAYSPAVARPRIIMKSPFSGAVDGLSNTIWAMEVEMYKPAEVIVSASIGIGTNDEPLHISRIEIDPYGINPVQTWIGTHSGGVGPDGPDTNTTPEFYDTTGSTGSFVNLLSQGIRLGDSFGGKIQTLDYRGVFSDDRRLARTINIVFRKTEPDYVSTDGKLRYHYMFGAKDLTITEHVYDDNATWVSSPLELPPEFNGDLIDAVSLVTKEEVPNDTKIKYYVAADVSDADNVGDFSWKEIVPIDDLRPLAENIVRFDGTNRISRIIKSDPDPANWELIELKSTGANDTLNPAPVFKDSSESFYRIAEFKDDYVLNSLKLEEGIDTVRSLHKDTEYTPGTGAVSGMDLAYWKDYVSGVDTDVDKTYTQLDTSNTFFDGSEVGFDFQSVYAETFLEVQDDLEILFKNCRKIDSNSKTWDVKVYLNGREVADMPVGTDEAIVPWKFNRGINHIILLATIPESDDANPNVYQGQVELMSPDKLSDWGTVKLGTWQYVDPFVMKHNETGEPQTFTIIERDMDGGVIKKEIVSRRTPTNRFRIQYTRPTGGSPTGLRLRADLSRDITNPYVSPKLDLYRLRFAYGGGS